LKVLDRKGIALALFFGFLLVHFGSLNYLLLMLLFFCLAIVVTRYGYEEKRELGLYEHERGWENVFANGILPALLAVGSSVLGPIPFICSIAAITSDKFGSEIGVMETENPVSIITFTKVKPGTSGAISMLGSIASLMGSALIAFGAMYLFHISSFTALYITLAGFIGSLADTLLGYFEERGIGTKGTTNFICSLVGALIGYFLIR
jgi:uncharacterized protein (TIGR00297 family)